MPRPTFQHMTNATTRTYGEFYVFSLIGLISFPLQAIKDLSESLQDARSSSAPKRKFAFKTKPEPVSSNTRKINAKSSNEAGQIASPQQPLNHNTIAATEANTSEGRTQVDTRNDVSGLDRTPPVSKSSRSSRSIEVSTRESEWYIASAASVSASDQVSASITNIKACVVDISARSTRDNPLAKAHILAARRSLIMCGHVSGSTFLSDSEGCILVATCGQMRLHNCKNGVVYLHCSSNPVIEGCQGIKFASLPSIFVSSSRTSCPFLQSKSFLRLGTVSNLTDCQSWQRTIRRTKP